MVVRKIKQPYLSYISFTELHCMLFHIHFFNLIYVFAPSCPNLNGTLIHIDMDVVETVYQSIGVKQQQTACSTLCLLQLHILKSPAYLSCQERSVNDSTGLFLYKLLVKRQYSNKMGQFILFVKNMLRKILILINFQETFLLVILILKSN